ncbi:MAG: DNA repair protein RadA [Lachnospiraceae bacterium]|nr:DNA repair protein RadA [Lachnospiraceae bacterium]
MPKSSSVFFCKECGFESSKWLGQCPGCKAWNSFVEEPVTKTKSGKTPAVANRSAEPVVLSKVSFDSETRISSKSAEFDRVLGGGIVKASLVLVGGDPGIGKSTLLLQTCKALSQSGVKVLYISGEESPAQIRMRAERLGPEGNDLLLLSQTSLDVIEETVTKIRPEIVVIDSIQTMYREDVSAAPGSVSQVRETTGALLRLGKSLAITIFIVGHVTKEGVVAGPRVLEHMVDTVLYFEGENSGSYRVLRAVKNRFGPTNEIGVFEMCGTGLKEVPNPSQLLIEGTPEGEPGSVVTASVEGTRTIMTEVQALVCQTSFNLPRRTAVGVDYNRVNMLMAVLEKRLGVKMSFCDAYVNATGGMKMSEPSTDLALVMAILSSFKNRPLAEKTVVFGEVGLSGEVRGVSMAENRVSEAVRLGMKTVILPAVNKKKIDRSDIELIGVSNVRDLAELL